MTASLPTGVNTIVEFSTGTVVRVKFENGAVATPFNRQSLAKSMADCQRYYNAMNRMYINPGYMAAGGAIALTFTMPTMRAAPTIVLANISYAGGSGLQAQQAMPGSFNSYFSSSGAGAAYSLADYLLSAEL